MSEEARKVIKNGAFTLPEVLAEVMYVLKGVYKVERTEIAATLMESQSIIRKPCVRLWHCFQKHALILWIVF